MGKISKTLALVLLLLFLASLIALPQNPKAECQGSQPVNSYFVLTSGIDFVAYEGVPFKIFIFAYDSEGHQTFNTYGNISLSVQSGTITPSTFGPAHEGLYAPMVTITGTNSAIITVSDSQGHTGKSITIPIISPTPIPSTTITTIPTPPADRNPPHLDPIIYLIPISIIVAIVMLSVLLYRWHRKTAKQTQ